MGISDGLLVTWIKEAEAAEEAGALDADERAEVERLRKENRELKMDREMLRQEAYFVRY